jgi:folate-binding Fe-S cluster repair protein YgfZ
MLNLDLLGAVSFKKGCYPGQEVIARMRYLGTLKRRLYRVHIATESVPQPGEEIMTADGGKVEPAGSIIDAQAHPDGGVAALTVLRVDAARREPLRLETAMGAAVEIKALPYNLDP